MGARLKRLVRRIANLVRWGSVDRDLRDEVEHHLEMAAAEHRRRGLAPEAARRRALQEFGGERWLEESRGTRGVLWLQDAWRDVRQGIRALRRQPVFAGAIIVVMALGTGASTAVYSVLRGVLSPLPYGDPGELYTLLEGAGPNSFRLLSYPTFREVAEASGSVAELAWIRGEGVLVRAEEGTSTLLGAFVTGNYFGLMRREPAAGRTLAAADASDPVIVVSARLARRMWGDAHSAVGQTLATADGTLTVVGVMPVGFAWPAWADFWAPLNALPAETRYAIEQRDLHVDSDVVVRIPAGTGVERVSQSLGVAIANASARHPAVGVHYDRAVLSPLRQRVIGDAAPPVGLLVGSVALILLLSVINVAGVMLARGTARRGELAARLALGAGRGRLVRQLMTEGALLGLIGGATGVALAGAALAWLRASAPAVLPRLDETGIDGGILLFSLAVTLLATLGAAALPALRLTSGAVSGDLRATARGSTVDRRAVHVRGVLVAAQIGLAVVLLVGASLLLRTAHALAQLDLGYDADGVVALRVMPPGRYADDDARMQLYGDLRDAVARVPGVASVALANHIPSTFMSMPTAVLTDREPAADENTLALFRSASWNYLHVIGAVAAAGRLPAAGDEWGGGIVVNETLARREWGEQDPIGRSITVFRSAQGAAGFGEPLPSHVVGVVRDLREWGPAAAPVPTVYVPVERNVWNNIHVVIRTARPLAGIVHDLRAAVRSVDPDIPTAGPQMSAEFRSLDDYQANITATRRLTTVLLSGFAVMAVVLALTGLFGVLAFSVAQRSREIGVRMAIGARGRDAAGLVFRQSAAYVLAGMAAGMLASVPATRVVEASLFGVERLDPLSYVAVCALFLLTAAAAAGMPALRAARVEPGVVLRAE